MWIALLSLVLFVSLVWMSRAIMDATSSGLSILLNNYNLMSKRATRSELQLGKVRDLAYRDALTGLKNKLAFTEAEYAPEKTPNFHTVFEQADQKMYQEKQLLKSMGAATRS